MNKKLFSWKALAGLALLVAMGLTSCQQDAVVNPTDPTGATKPVQPSATVKDANVSVTVTKTSDFAEQWNSKVSSTVLAELAKKNEITIEINCGAFELDGTTLDLPAIWANANGKTLNVILSGAFKKAEKELVIKTDNVAGAVVNFTLPATKFSFNLDASHIVANLASVGAIIEKFTAKANTGKNGVTIGSGVTVNSIVAQGGDFVGTVNAVYVNADPTIVSKKGVNINQTTENIVKNLIVDGTVTVTKDGDTEMGDITVLKGGKLTIGTLKAVSSIIGTKPAETELTFATAGDIAKVALIKNMKVTNTAWINLDKATVDNVEFAGPVELSSTTIANVTFDDNVQINVDADNKTYNFNGVSFAAATWINMNSTLKQSTSKTTTSYYWDITASKWVEVTATTPNIYAADKQVKVDVSQDGANQIYSVSAAGALSTELAKKVSATTNTISITTIWYDNLAPKGVVVALDKNCKQGGAAIDGEYLTNLFGTKWSPSACWFKVSVDGTMYAWKELATGGYILVKE
jgi:hypothetical protein